MADDSTERWLQKPLDFKLGMLKQMDDLLQLEAKKMETMHEMKRALIGHWMKDRVPNFLNIDPRYVLRMVRVRLKTLDAKGTDFYLEGQLWNVEEARYFIEWIVPILDKRDTRTFLLSAQIRQEARRYELSKQREAEEY